MICDRIKSERKKIGLTQAAFGSVANAKSRTVIDWEKGATTPTASQLEALSKIGIDVAYIITGELNQSDLPPDLPPDEYLLLDAYRALPVPKRREMLAVLITQEKK